MRTGILSDENAVAYKPLDVPTNERFLGHHHADKQQKQSRKRKDGHKNTPRARYPQHVYHDLAQLINPNDRSHIEVFETQARSYANPRPTQSFQAAVRSFRKSYPDLFASTRLATNPFIINNTTVGRKNVYPETAYYFSQLDNVDVMKAFLNSRQNLSGHYLNLPLHTHVERLIHDKPERSVEFEKLFKKTMELFVGDASFKPDRVKPERLNDQLIPHTPPHTPTPATPGTPPTPTT